MSHVLNWSMSVNHMPFASRVVPADMSDIVNTPLPTPSGPEDFMILTLCCVIDVMFAFTHNNMPEIPGITSARLSVTVLCTLVRRQANQCHGNPLWLS